MIGRRAFIRLLGGTPDLCMKPADTGQEPGTKTLEPREVSVG